MNARVLRVAVPLVGALASLYALKVRPWMLGWVGCHGGGADPALAGRLPHQRRVRLDRKEDRQRHMRFDREDR